MINTIVNSQSRSRTIVHMITDFFLTPVNYVITNYEKHYIDNTTVGNSTCLMKILV